MCLFCAICTVAGVLVALLYPGNRPPAWVGFLSAGLMFGPWLGCFIWWVLHIPASPRYRSWREWEYGRNPETLDGAYDELSDYLEEEESR